MNRADNRKEQTESNKINLLIWNRQGSLKKCRVLWGRGIEKITDACKQAGLPGPIIEERIGGVAIELPEARISEELGNRWVMPKSEFSLK